MKRLAYLITILLLAGCSAQTGPSPSTVPVPPQTALVRLAARPATIIYASTVYTFAVPAQDEHGDSDVTAGDVPGGIIWLTPPGFPDAAAHAIRNWSLWFTPASTTGGSLWTGAQLWQTFPNEQAPRLVGVTGGYVIISLTDGTQTQIMGVGLVDGRTVNIARYAPPTVAGYGHGVYAWQDPNRQLHVVKLATGEEQLIALPALSRIDIVGGGILVDGQVVKSPLVDKPTDAPVPAGYKWIGPDQAKPEIAVPDTWIVGPIPGGSSAGVSATNPQDPNEKVTMWDSNCAGCQDPGINSPHRYASWSSPLVDVAQGETYTWLDDHTVAFTLPPDGQNPYPTYGVNRTFVERPGNQVAKVSMPANDRQTATIILNSMLSRP
ncbi:MAG: hypothetical protein JWN15_1241 [Firmicutes bacterium]|nr:hypothetical protein [Bacillota bacterium]